MSRAIRPSSKPAIPAEDRSLRDTRDGKLLFTTYRGKKGAFLIQNNRLIAALFPEKSKLGSIYVARVKDVAKNIDACFVDIGGGEICFLPLQEAACSLIRNRVPDGRILAGDELPVQVARDAQKTKQATVSAHLSLSNDYFVLAFGTGRANFSAKLSGEQKMRLTELLTEEKILENGALAQGIFQETTGVKIPPVGLVVRTRAAEALAGESSSDCLIRSFYSLAEELKQLLRNAIHRTVFTCLKESDNLLSGVLDTATRPEEYGEIVTDDEEVYLWLSQYTAEHMPEKPVRMYQDPLLSLSRLYSLESRLSTATEPRVWLRSGGYLVIQPTEALTVIDVNSGKYESGSKAGDQAAILINQEAAAEIALQLRLRNLSGIIIVDFINMEEESSRQKLIDHLDALVKQDRVKAAVIDMTPLGLVEITRKKTTKPLYEQLAKTGKKS